MESRLLTVLTCVLVVSLPATAEVPMANQVPAETMVFVGWAGRNLAFDGSKLGQLLTDPALAKMFEAIEETILDALPDEQQAALLKRGRKMLSIAWQHPIALAVIEAAPGKEDDGPPTIRAALLVDLGKDKTDFAALLDALLDDLAEPVGQATVGAVTCKVIETELGEVFIGFKDTLLFVCSGGETARQIVTLTAEQSLQADRNLTTYMQVVDGENVQLAYYVDLQALLKTADTFQPTTATAEDEAEPSARQQSLDALGLDRATVLASTTRVVDRHLYVKSRLFSPAPHRGILMPLAGPAITEEDLAGIPADADYAAVMKLSPGKFYQELRGILKGISPELDTKLGKEVTDMEEELGISLQDDLLAALGDVWVISSAPSQGGFLTGTVLSVSVKDAEKLSATIAKIESATGLRESPDESDGEPDAAASETAPATSTRARGAPALQITKAGSSEIHYITAGSRRMPAPVAPAWALHENCLYLALWPQVVAAAVDNPQFKPLTDEAAFRALRKRVHAKPSVLTYVNTPKVVRQVYNVPLVAWTSAANFMRADGIDAKPAWLPPLPSIEKYLSPEIGAITADEEGITFESYSSLPLAGLLPPVDLMGAAIVRPSLIEARRQAKRAVSMGNMNILGKAIQMYMAVNDRPPANLEALLEERLMTAAGLKSPFSDQPAPQYKDGQLTGEVDYIYLPPVSADMNSRLIVAYEKLEHYRGKGTVVLYYDGAVGFLATKQFEEAIARRMEADEKASGQD